MDGCPCVVDDASCDVKNTLVEDEKSVVNDSFPPDEKSDETSIDVEARSAVGPQSERVSDRALWVLLSSH